MSSVECPSTKISSVPLPITGVRASAAATLPASLRVGTITLTLAAPRRAPRVAASRST